MIIIHKEVYTRGLGQNAESEQERRFGGLNKRMDRDDLESPGRRLEGWDCHVAVLVIREHGLENKPWRKEQSSGKSSPRE